MRNPNTQAPRSSEPLYEISQRFDGSYAAWVKKSPLELGMVDRAEIESYRPNGPFTDDEWADFIALPHVSGPTIPVIIHVDPKNRPTTSTIFKILGVQHTQKPEGNNNYRNRRPARSDNAPEAVAA